MPRHAQSIDSKIHSRIYGNKRGWVFTPRQFQDLGSSAAIEVALRRQDLQHAPAWVAAVMRQIAAPEPYSQPDWTTSRVLGLTGNGRAALFSYSRQEVEPRGYVDFINLESQATGIDSTAALLAWGKKHSPRIQPE